MHVLFNVTVGYKIPFNCHKKIAGLMSLFACMNIIICLAGTSSTFVMLFMIFKYICDKLGSFLR